MQVNKQPSSGMGNHKKWPLRAGRILLLILPALVLGLAIGLASANAPYVTFYYSDPAGTVLLRDVTVTTETPGTYYCALGWFGTDGYAGLQMTPGQRGNDGKTFYKHLHFSLWDTPTNQAIPMIWKRPEVVVDGFGGEGTGVKSMWPFDWKVGETYTIALKTWDTGPAQTAWGMWFRDGAKNQWYRTATWGYPKAGITIPAGTYSFLEDYLGTNQTREMRVGPSWKKNLAGKWVGIKNCSARERDGLPAWNAAVAGAAGDAFMVRTGGSTQATIVSGATLTSDFADAPTLSGQTPTLTAEYQAGALTAAWKVDSSKSPPFAYKLEVFNTPQMTGASLGTEERTDPSALRDTVANLHLPDGNYTARLTLIDIFDEKSTATAAFTVGVSALRGRGHGAILGEAKPYLRKAGNAVIVGGHAGGEAGLDGRAVERKVRTFSP